MMILYLLFVCTLCVNVTYGQECVQSLGELNTQVVTEFECVILDCMNITVNSTGYTFDGWILPDVTYINSTYDDGKVIVDDEGWTITVRNISREDTGLYHCMLIYQGEYYLQRMGLNIKGPFFITRWEEYEMNTIVGLAAFGSFLVLSLVVWLLWRFHYVSDDVDSLYGSEKEAIDGFGATPYTLSTINSGVDYKPEKGHPRVKSYIHTQVSLEELSAPGLDTMDNNELRKRNNVAVDKLTSDDKQSNGLVKPALIQGVDNPAFIAENRSSVDYDALDNLDNVEVTEL